MLRPHTDQAHDLNCPSTFRQTKHALQINKTQEAQNKTTQRSTADSTVTRNIHDDKQHILLLIRAHRLTLTLIPPWRFTYLAVGSVLPGRAAAAAAANAAAAVTRASRVVAATATSGAADIRHAWTVVVRSRPRPVIRYTSTAAVHNPTKQNQQRRG